MATSSAFKRGRGNISWTSHAPFGILFSRYRVSGIFQVPGKNKKKKKTSAHREPCVTSPDDGDDSCWWAYGYPVPVPVPGTCALYRYGYRVRFILLIYFCSPSGLSASTYGCSSSTGRI